MLNFLSKAWDSISLFLSGWKTHLTAFVLIFINAYDALAGMWDWNKIFSNPTTAMLVNGALGILVVVFRQMAKTANSVADLASEKTDGNS